VFIKLNLEGVGVSSSTPINSRQKSAEIYSPKQVDNGVNSYQYLSFQSPTRLPLKGKPPLSPNISSISNTSNLSSTASKTDSPAKVQSKSKRYRQLSVGFVLSKEKFIEKVINENNKLGVCN